MKGIFILATIAVFCSVIFISTYNNGSAGEYEAFIAKYGRSYNSVEEFDFRRRIFEAHVAYYKKFNSEGHTWTLGVNQFADMTDEEIKSFFSLTATDSNSKSKIGEIQALAGANKDTEIDWRAEGYVRPIKNQGSCGSCWAFAANVGVEAAWKKFAHLHDKEIDLPNLSEQILVDCDKNSLGCNGGFMDNAYFYYTSQCPVDQAAYPYTASDDACKAEGKECVTHKLLGWYSITNFDDVALREALNIGPVPVAIRAENPDFYAYKGGVISGTGCGWQLDHGVGLVGQHFEKDNNGNQIKVWDIRNSWGTEWGEAGYVRIQREDIFVKDEEGKKYNVGVCGINQQNSIPTFMEY